MITDALRTLLDRRDLSRAEAREVMNEVMRAMRYGSRMAMKAKIGSPITIGADMRGRFTPPSTSMPAVIASSSASEPKSGCSASSTISTMATPMGLSIAPRWR